MAFDNERIRAQLQEQKPVFTALRRASIAHQLRARMLEKKIRSIDVAQRLGVSEANVSRLLNGSQNLSLDTLYGLADALEESLIVKLQDPESMSAFLRIEDPSEDVDWKNDDDAANDPGCDQGNSRFLRAG